ncbi:hypothetical protein DFQ27_002281 [Actinomortierella ambigua]|uniref:Uncharacterized protein n=1 Tax=Actinomortierella ambigua TaxID=1343610 RepID=A0A9P6Q9R7_9FUNG|nr:hypothetical protein DFQ27_002281 [Actinomortierella ambigua]
MKFTSAIVSVLAAASLVSAGKLHLSDPNLKQNAVIPGAFIIQYEDNFDHVKARNAFRDHQVEYQVRSQYRIFNGASINVNSQHDGKALARIPGVKHVWPLEIIEQPINVNLGYPKELLELKPELATAHEMTGVNILHHKYKYHGKGVKVGVIDSGIDYKHPALGGCFGKGCRVRYGWDFVGDEYSAGKTPKPDGDPMDCGGHGTHVAGIVGAKNDKKAGGPFQFTGVAPEVTFGAYRVFGCSGSTNPDIILNAMELAFNQGMDIINMSLGAGSSYKYNPTAVLGDQLVQRGLIMVTSGGNNGDQGVWMVGNTGLGDGATSTASVDNVQTLLWTMTYGGKPYPYSPSSGWTDKYLQFPAGATLVPIFEKDGTLSDGCDTNLYKDYDVKGKVVLVLGDITRCKSGARAANAQAAGAVGGFIQTTPLGISNIGGTPGFPMGSIEFRGGEALIAEWRKNPGNTFTFATKQTIVPIEGGGGPSDFSSLGFDGELRLKPDISAPGGNIYSTLPRAQGSYGIKSGTSMASPYVAGAHALWISAKKSKPSGTDLRRTFKNTADHLRLPGRETFASVAKQGAGMVNVLNAIRTTTTASPDKIELLDTVKGQKTISIKIKNSGKSTETYTLSHIPADSLNSYAEGSSFPLLEPEVGADYASVRFSTPSITVRAGKTATVKVFFIEPTTGNAAKFPIYSGFIIAKPKTKGSVSVSIPYAGLKGDFSKVPIHDVDSGLPAVASIAAGKVTVVQPGHKFDLTKESPVIFTRIGSHTPDMTIRVFDDKKNFVGYLASSNLGKASGWSGRDKDTDDFGRKVFRSWQWAGSVYKTKEDTDTVKLPSGTYSIVVAAQRKFTVGNYPADYEIHNMGSYTI